MIDLPDLPEDTIYLSPAPDGQVGEYYEEDISFRMPKTTTPVAAVDPDVVPDVAIESITILSVTNVPPGLNWELDQSEFILADTTDGCIRFCGSPLQPGLYMVEVIVEAQVFFFTEVAAFEFPIFIAPGVSNTDGFTILNTSGCGSVTAGFVNNNPSNGDPRFSYTWDFGNGNTTSDENPSDQLYDAPGIYEVAYQAVVDTNGYFLTRVNVLSASCDDLFNNAPDLMFKVFDEDGEEIFSSVTLNNSAPPVDFTLSLELGEGNYSLRVIDDDDGINGGDDNCGEVNFNRFTTGVLNDGALSVELEIFHPVDTVIAVDTIQVFEQPAPPVVEGLPDEPLCAGDIFTLTTTFVDGLQWYKDSLALVGDTLNTVDVTETGMYWVTLTTEDGCSASSAPVDVIFNALPTVPVFVNNNNLLSVFDTGALPDNYSLEWLLNGVVIPEVTDTVFCIPGTAEYTLVVTDEDTNCQSSYTQTIEFDADFPGCIMTSLGTLDQLLNRALLSPNPVRESAVLFLEARENFDLQWQVLNSFGQEMDRGEERIQMGDNTINMGWPSLPSGVYWLRLRSDNQQVAIRFVKQ
jgi:hypothetical protein